MFVQFNCKNSVQHAHPIDNYLRCNCCLDFFWYGRVLLKVGLLDIFVVLTAQYFNEDKYNWDVGDIRGVCDLLCTFIYIYTFIPLNAYYLPPMI